MREVVVAADTGSDGVGFGHTPAGIGFGRRKRGIDVAYLFRRAGCAATANGQKRAEIPIGSSRGLDEIAGHGGWRHER